MIITSCFVQNATSDNAVIQLSAVQAARWENKWKHTHQLFFVYDNLKKFFFPHQKTALKWQKPPHRRLDKIWDPAYFSQMPGEEW